MISYQILIYLKKESDSYHTPIGRKKDSLYFRGAITGQLQSLENPRVAACLAAKQIPDADCKLTSFPQTTASLVNEIKTRKLSAKKDKVFALNKHRYLLDIDGNTSSWHRFLLTDTFGCVPIRFETQWIECWHKHLKVNHSFVPATRHTLTEDIDSLRKQPDKAIFIARNASSITRKFLSLNHSQKMFEEAWFDRCE